MVPPLRERKEDILPLAQSFLAFYSKQTHSQTMGFTSGTAEALMRHDWPGNVRELRNTIERAVLLCKGPQIEIDHFSANPDLVAKQPNPGDPVPLEKIEVLHTRRVLASTRSIEEASRILKVDLVMLWRRRKKYLFEPYFIWKCVGMQFLAF